MVSRSIRERVHDVLARALPMAAAAVLCSSPVLAFQEAAAPAAAEGKEMTIGGLIKQAPPNDGILNAVGKLGPSISGPVAFDIESDGKDGNVAWLVHGGTLHTVDLMTGKAMAIGAISGVNGAISDIAVLPAK